MMSEPGKFYCTNRNHVLILVLLIFVISFGIVIPLVDEHADLDRNRGPTKYAVIRENFPDPCLATDLDGKYYAFATGNESIGINIQIASALSTNLSQWTLHKHKDALPVLGSWALQPHSIAQVWAPEVVQRVSPPLHLV
jgi:hypothetical protein